MKKDHTVSYVQSGPSRSRDAPGMTEVPPAIFIGLGADRLAAGLLVFLSNSVSVR